MVGAVSNTPFVSRPFVVDAPEHEAHELWARETQAARAHELYLATRLADGVDRPNATQRLAVEAHFLDGFREEAGRASFIYAPRAGQAVPLQLTDGVDPPPRDGGRALAGAGWR